MSESGKTWDIIKARYVLSAVWPEQYPTDALSEVAFIGRSNVGKSSLINSLCRTRGLAKTSASPGKTRTVNFFLAEAKYTNDEIAREKFFLVDLPGYGFAKAGKADKAAWAEFIRVYLRNSKQIKMIYQLIDIRHDLMKNDRECYDWLVTLPFHVQVIFTKADKLSQPAALRQKAKLCRELGMEAGEAVVFSAVKNTGRQELIEHIVQSI